MIPVNSQNIWDQAIPGDTYMDITTSGTRNIHIKDGSINSDNA